MVVACCCGRDLDFQSVRRLVRALLCKGTPVICLYHCENQTYANQRSWPERVCRAAGVWLCVGALLVMLVGTHTYALTKHHHTDHRSAKVALGHDDDDGRRRRQPGPGSGLHDEEERIGAQIDHHHQLFEAMTTAARGGKWPWFSCTTKNWSTSVPLLLRNCRYL